MKWKDKFILVPFLIHAQLFHNVCCPWAFCSAPWHNMGSLKMLCSHYGKVDIILFLLLAYLRSFLGKKVRHFWKLLNHREVFLLLSEFCAQWVQCISGAESGPVWLAVLLEQFSKADLLIKLCVYRKWSNLEAELCVPFQTPSWLFRIELLSAHVDSLASSIQSSHSQLWKFLYGTYLQYANCKS